MPFTKLQKQEIKEIVDGLCQGRSLGCQPNQPKVISRIRTYDVNLYRCSPSLVKSHKPVEIPIAKLRFDPKNSEWTLFFLTDKGQWVQYPDLLHLCNLEAAVGEIKHDPLHVFWG
jgi:hypothetical protein